MTEGAGSKQSIDSGTEIEPGLWPICFIRFRWFNGGTHHPLARVQECGCGDYCLFGCCSFVFFATIKTAQQYGILCGLGGEEIQKNNEHGKFGLDDRPRF